MSSVLEDSAVESAVVPPSVVVVDSSLLEASVVVTPVADAVIDPLPVIVPVSASPVADSVVSASEPVVSASPSVALVSASAIVVLESASPAVELDSAESELVSLASEPVSEPLWDSESAELELSSAASEPASSVPVSPALDVLESEAPESAVAEPLAPELVEDELFVSASPESLELLDVGLSSSPSASPCVPPPSSVVPLPEFVVVAVIVGMLGPVIPDALSSEDPAPSSSQALMLSPMIPTTKHR